MRTLDNQADLCDEEAARRQSASWTEASVWLCRPAGPTPTAKEASPRGERPGRAPRRTDPFSEVWGSSQPSSDPRCLETLPPAVVKGWRSKTDGKGCDEEGRGKDKQEMMQLVMLLMRSWCVMAAGLVPLYASSHEKQPEGSWSDAQQQPKIYTKEQLTMRLQPQVKAVY